MESRPLEWHQCRRLLIHQLYFCIHILQSVALTIQALKLLASILWFVSSMRNEISWGFFVSIRSSRTHYLSKKSMLRIHFARMLTKANFTKIWTVLVERCSSWRAPPVFNPDHWKQCDDHRRRQTSWTEGSSENTETERLGEISKKRRFKSCINKTRRRILAIIRWSRNCNSKPKALVFLARPGLDRGY
jgi:hypothetical protein